MGDVSTTTLAGGGGGGGGGGGSGGNLSASCFDGIINQGEVWVDCGGPCAPCTSCSDGIQNQGENGVDCGGPCTPCMMTTSILSSSTTSAPQVTTTHAGGKTSGNGGSTGTSRPKTTSAKNCSRDKDCVGGICLAGKCVNSTCFDKLLSFREEKIDCGGDCPPCPKIRTNGTYYVGENLIVTVEHAWPGLTLTIKEPGEEPTHYNILSVNADKEYVLVYVPYKEGMLSLRIDGGYDERYVKIKSRQIIPLLEDVPPEVRSLLIPLLLLGALLVWLARRRTKVVVDEQILEGFELYTMDYMNLTEKYKRFYTAADREDKYSNLIAVAFVELNAEETAEADAISAHYGLVPSIGRALSLCKKLHAKTYLTTADLPEEISENYNGTKIIRP